MSSINTDLPRQIIVINHARPASSLSRVFWGVVIGAVVLRVVGAIACLLEDATRPTRAQ